MVWHTQSSSGKPHLGHTIFFTHLFESDSLCRLPLSVFILAIVRLTSRILPGFFTLPPISLDAISFENSRCNSLNFSDISLSLSSRTFLFFIIAIIITLCFHSLFPVPLVFPPILLLLSLLVLLLLFPLELLLQQYVQVFLLKVRCALTLF